MRRKRRGRALNGEGTAIRQRTDGYWECKSPVLPNGKRKSYSGRTPEEAKQKRDADAALRAQGLPLPGERWRVGPFLTFWLASVQVRRRESTAERYEQFARRYITPEVGHLWLTDLDRTHVQALCDKAATRLSPGTVHQLRKTVHVALNFAIKKGLLVVNAAQHIDLPSVEKKAQRTLSPVEVIRFFAAIRGDRLEALYTLAFWTGMRVGELLALRWNVVDLEHGALTINASVRYRHRRFHFTRPKTRDSTRPIKIAPMAVAALHAHKARQADERASLGPYWQGADKRDNDLVFSTHWGSPLDGTNVLKYFQHLLAEAKLPRMRLHDLRHTFATLQLRAKTPVKTVSVMLGHANTRITMDLYQHVDLDEQADALAAMERYLGQAL